MANPKKDNVTQAASQAASAAADKAKDVASDVQDTARGLAERAGEMASNVGNRADSAVSSAGSGLQSAAETVRGYAPESGMLRSAASAVADTLESTGEYLEQQGLSGIADDLTNLVRRNPIPALLIGIGVGYLIARATRS